MAKIATRADFVAMIAEEVSSGIDRAVQYWLGKIELEVTDQRLTTAERISAIERIIREYKDAADGVELRCASA